MRYPFNAGYTIISVLKADKQHKGNINMKIQELRDTRAINLQTNGKTLRVVQISGGKDSQATAKLIRSLYPNDNIIGLFCDTGFEHPKTYKHVNTICDLYNLQLVTLKEGTVEQKVKRYGRYPSDMARFCTDELKIIPAKKYLIGKALEGFNVINYLGVRSDESPARTIRYGQLSEEDSISIHPHEFMPSKCPKYMGLALNIQYSTPILSWSKGDVFTYLNGEENPLYGEGFDRVGCFPCLAGGDKAKLKAFRHDSFGREQYRKAKALEHFVIDAGHHPLFKTKIGIKGEQKDLEGNGCSYCSM